MSTHAAVPPAVTPPALDMARFHQVFFAETAEHLATLERLLVAIDVAAPEAEDLDAIFRAAHSVKGGSGTFGFEEMTEVTHELESLLDRVRRSELALSVPMVDVLLAANDLLRAQLAHYMGDAEAPGVPVAAMCARIHACGETASRDAEPLRELELVFARPTDAHTDLDALLDELAGLGTVRERPAADVAGEWRVRIATAATDEALLAPFGFIVDPQEVSIRECAAPAENAPAAADDEASGYGFFADAPGVPSAAPTATAATPAAPTDAAGASAATPPAERAASTPATRPGNGSAAGEAVEGSIRVGVSKVDALVNLVGELVITQAMLAQTAAALDPSRHERLLSGLNQLERNTRDLQQSVMAVRMMPMAEVFNRFPRLVRDIAAKLGKEVLLKTEGEATELDKGLIEKLADPLTHLVRNSLDHGIEPADDRARAGKPPRGTITLSAFHRAGNVVIEVADDGAGLSRERILAKAKERGMPVHDGMTDSEVWMQIFEPGLSTAAVVTDVSGRGVGMDVVRRNIRELGGRVDVDSAAGVGTRISIRLPLTLAILDGMSVGVSGETFIIPLNHVVESLRVASGDVKTVNGDARLIAVRGEYLPVVALQEAFGLPPPAGDTDGGVMVILDAEGVSSALLVDELLGQHQVVIKSLEKNYRKVPGISGATIMGDGRVAMILDVPALVQRTRH